MLRCLGTRFRLMLEAIEKSGLSQAASLGAPAKVKPQPQPEQPVTPGPREPEVREPAPELASSVSVSREALYDHESLGKVLEHVSGGSLPEGTHRQELAGTARMLKRFFEPMERFEGPDRSGLAVYKGLVKEGKDLETEIGRVTGLMSDRAALKQQLTELSRRGVSIDSEDYTKILKQLEPIEEALLPMQQLVEPADSKLKALQSQYGKLRQELRDTPIVPDPNKPSARTNDEILGALGKVEEAIGRLQHETPTVFKAMQERLAEVNQHLEAWNQPEEAPVRGEDTPSVRWVQWQADRPDPGPAFKPRRPAEEALLLGDVPEAPPVSAPAPRSLAIQPAVVRIKAEITKLEQELKREDLPPADRKTLADRLVQRKEGLAVLEKGEHAVPRKSDMLKDLDRNIFVRQMDRAAPEIMLGRMIAMADRLEERVQELRDMGLHAGPKVRQELAATEAELSNFKEGLPKVQAMIQSGLEAQVHDLRAEVTRMSEALTNDEPLSVEEQARMKSMQKMRDGLLRQIDMAKDDPVTRAGLVEELKGFEAGLIRLQDRQELADKQQHLTSLENRIEHLDQGKMAWSHIKEQYMGADTQELFTMQAVVDFRKQYSNMLLGEVRAHPEYKGEFVETNSGSSDITSDIDINIRSKGKVGVEKGVVSDFNQTFTRSWGMESGSVMDVNLYTKGMSQDWEAAAAAGPRLWASPEAQAAHDRGQTEAALFKLRRNMGSDPAEWNKFAKQVVDKLPPEQQGDVRELFKKIGDEFVDYRRGIDERKQALSEKYPDLNDFDLELKATNQIYMEEMSKTDEVMGRLRAAEQGKRPPEEQDALYAESTASISRSYRYANEAYLSEGPSNQVIGNEQKLKGLATVEGVQRLNPGKDKPQVPVNCANAIQSMCENYGFIVEEFHNHHGASLETAAIRTSKYFGRVCRAVDLAADAPDRKLAVSGDMRATKELLEQTELPLLTRRKGNLGNDIGPSLKRLEDGGITSSEALQTTLRTLVVDSLAAYFRGQTPLAPQG